MKFGSHGYSSTGAPQAPLPQPDNHDAPDVRIHYQSRESVFSDIIRAGVTGAFIGLAVGILAGMVITPDLDLLATGNVRRFGLRQLWRLYWYPYSRLITHRHWLSHAPVVGTIGRLVYLLPMTWWAWQYPAMLWAVLGLAIADLAHFVMDL